jgi:hypothetical protein
MVIVVAQLVCHSSVVLSPAVTSAGLAAKVRITGLDTVVVAIDEVSVSSGFCEEGTRDLAFFALDAMVGQAIVFPVRQLYIPPLLSGTHPEPREKNSTSAIPIIRNL